MGQAVADRTINRKIVDESNPNGWRYERWEEVAFRVAKGNSSLHSKDADDQFLKMDHHLKKATLLKMLINKDN